MHTGYVDAMLNLARPTQARNALGQTVPLEVRFFRGGGWCPARRHASICEQALHWGADLICIVGADQIHPADMLCRLIGRWDEGYEVISALVPARGYVGWQDMQPFQRMAWRLKPSVVGLGTGAATANEIEAINPADGDVQPINFIGSGVLMFHRDHLLALTLPWFSEDVDAATYVRTGSMDTRFVWRLQAEAGARVWVDTTIPVRHLHAFEIDESFPARFADWARPGAGDPAICQFESPRLALRDA